MTDISKCVQSLNLLLDYKHYPNMNMNIDMRYLAQDENTFFICFMVIDRANHSYWYGKITY